MTVPNFLYTNQVKFNYLYYSLQIYFLLEHISPIEIYNLEICYFQELHMMIIVILMFS